MRRIRRSEERGKADHGWLRSYHTFSFADYHDPAYMGFGSLRVINEDRVAPGRGFSAHPHRNMEIFSYVVSGALAHRDSLGNERTVRAGELQAMSAGTGVVHSEFNPSPDTPVHFLQIWITPAASGLSPSYSEWKPASTSSTSLLTLLASPDARDGSVRINQDAEILLGHLPAHTTLDFPIASERRVWLQLISGELSLSAETLSPGDGLALTDEPLLTVTSNAESSFLLFSLGV